MKDGNLQEADLDLEWAGAIAQNATLIYVNATNAWDSLQYAITSNLAPVISVSYSACEVAFSPSDVQSFALLGQQANAQGQTIVAVLGGYRRGRLRSSVCDASYERVGGKHAVKHALRYGRWRN